MVKKGYHPDLMVIEPEENSVKIEQIRNGLKFLFYHPQISSLKILIINEADKMTEDCQNALLKTLEEPRDNNIIILISSAPKRLLETIRSRVLPLRFTMAANKEIVDFLQKHYSLSQTEAEEIAERADGKIGKVVKLLDKDYKKELDQKRKDLIEILNQDFAKQSVYFQKITENNGKLTSTLEEWLRALRSDKYSKELDITPEKKIKLMDSILKAIYLITDTNINKQLLMENIFLQL
jgi:DNA polymerase-3 subunit delta'